MVEHCGLANSEPGRQVKDLLGVAVVDEEIVDLVRGEVSCPRPKSADWNGGWRAQVVELVNRGSAAAKRS